MRASEKSSIITNGKSTVRFSSYHKWTLCVTNQSRKGWLKTRIFTFGIAFHIFFAGNHRHFTFAMWVEHFALPYTSSYLVIAKTSNLKCRLNVTVTAYGWKTNCPQGMVRSCDPFKNFWGSNHMTGMVEHNVVKFSTRVGYINSSNRITYHQQKGWL